MTYSTYLLDFEHTLFDSNAAENAAYEQALSEAGVVDPIAHRPAYDRINRALWQQVEAGEIGPDEVRFARFSQLANAIGADFDPVTVGDTFAAAIADNGNLFPGAREVLETLASRATVAMVTNAMGSVQRSRIERLGIGDLFSAVVISGEIGTSKPHAGIFDIAFEYLGQPDRASAVMIGDSLSSDIRGGINAGVPTCWYNPGAAEAPSEMKPTHTITTLDQILGLRPAT
jgi:2-haloacid dehalogenase